MKDVNAIISKTDVHFFPEINSSQIELTLRCAKGDVLFRCPMNNESMFKILGMFRTDSIYNLNGQYCRMSLDEITGRIDHISNIIYDECGIIQDDPVA